MSIKKFIGFLLCVCVLMVSSTPVFSVIAFNDIKDGFNGGDEIEDSIIQGSTEFLKCTSNIYDFFSQYEQSERSLLSYEASKNAIDSAIKKLEFAISHYETALNIGKLTGYNQDSIYKMKIYNYSQFITDKGMIPTVANTVVSYLSQGDIVGIYKQNISNLKLILVSLASINDSLMNNKKPDKEVVWKLLSDLTVSTLCGNYATMFALEILK